jgi:dolichol-phosphate mannosyltransferase
MKKLISIIIPVYRNEGSLHPTYVNLKAILEDISASYDYEIIFINDGSDDDSLKELFAIKKIDSNVKIIDFVRNFGQVSAIQAGFEDARGDLLVNISADMQDPPSLILDMIRKWEDGYKVVACSRADREDDLISRITSKIFYDLMRVSVPKMPRGGFDYFLLDRAVYKKSLT